MAFSYLCPIIQYNMDTITSTYLEYKSKYKIKAKYIKTYC